MSSRLFVGWQRQLGSKGIARVPTSKAPAVLATEGYLDTKTYSTGHASDGSGGDSYYSSEERLFQLRKAEKVCVVVVLAAFDAEQWRVHTQIMTT